MIEITNEALTSELKTFQRGASLKMKTSTLIIRCKIFRVEYIPVRKELGVTDEPIDASLPLFANEDFCCEK